MAFRQAFDQRLYLWEFTHFIEYGLETGDKGSLPAAERRLLDDGLQGHCQATFGATRGCSVTGTTIAGT